MKSVSSDLNAHLTREVLTLATCWKLQRRDGVAMGFTDHDRNLSIGGVTYAAQTGITPSAVAASSNLNVDNLDVQGMLDANSISEDDVMAGLYDFAEIEVFQMNHEAPQQGALMLRRGWLGEITLRNGQFVAEVRGLTQKLSQQIGNIYAPACRAALGDARCGVALGSYTLDGTVDSSEGKAGFTDAARGQANGYFSGGKVTFTSGANAGLSMEVKAFAQGVFTLALPMPYTIAAGDGYSAVAGCDKNFPTCVARFDNALNFRGEPHVPGMDRMLETSATRSRWE